MKLTTKKTLWIFAMAIVLSVLGLVVNSRIKLSSDVIIGGADGAFVESTGLKDALYGYDEVGEIVIRAPEGLDYPNLDIENWRYLLANKDNTINKYEPEKLKESRQKGIMFDDNALSAIDNLLEAAEEAGFTPYVTCSYVSYEEQKEIFTDKAKEIAENGGYSMDEAKEIAAKLVAYPGTSEHQTGLCIDIADKEYEEIPDYAAMDKQFFRWLDANCAEYGFIKRYPPELKSLTGWDEPWHYRYVGKEAAQFIMENDLCLEEFIDHYR